MKKLKSADCIKTVKTKAVSTKEEISKSHSKCSAMSIKTQMLEERVHTLEVKIKDRERYIKSLEANEKTKACMVRISHLKDKQLIQDLKNYIKILEQVIDHKEPESLQGLQGRILFNPIAYVNKRSTKN